MKKLGVYSNDHSGLRLWLLLGAACTVALFGGCGNSTREGLEGTVTLDGKPLENGYIALRPQPGTESPSAGAKIADGEFSVAAERGLLPGKFRVEITASRPTGKKARDRFTGEMVTIDEQIIPAKYNTESKLEAEVGPGKPQRVEFAINSK